MSSPIRSYGHLAMPDSTPALVDKEIEREKALFASTITHLENIKKQLIAKQETR